MRGTRGVTHFVFFRTDRATLTLYHDDDDDDDDDD